MSKVLVFSLLSLSRRCHSAAAASARAVPGVARRAAAAAETAAMESGGPAKEEIFWMRDPKTGCWIPENRFDEVDAAELRARYLPKKN
ncbi:protein SENESCENCE-ASSOCIATED GENE 21, mitochondrial-like [Phoenix dactylifera]|uniref:Protein SENESCENCE-ASSOCIATED GENE 21, mitochondrial-like n=1 Tax=Phoenix dactylifera TaxID=42345 RepID=A0A8B8J1P4_PHODC|nr:protein SENESCENCE-ASSOCIATED GENE 21, mitochondrial-like [Phoenix dactylifera]